MTGRWQEGEGVRRLEHSRFDALACAAVEGASRAVRIGLAVNRVIGIGGATAASRRVRGCVGFLPELVETQRHSHACIIRGRRSQKWRFSAAQGMLAMLETTQIGSIAKRQQPGPRQGMRP
jgi:hypothetical protein